MISADNIRFTFITSGINIDRDFRLLWRRSQPVMALHLIAICR